MDLEKYYKKYNFPASSTFIKQLKNEGIKTTKQEIDKFIGNRVEQQKTIHENEQYLHETRGNALSISVSSLSASLTCVPDFI